MLLSCRITPEVSLPTVTNPAPMRARYFLITTYSESVHSNVFFGYMQETGKEPKESQPVSYIR